ncbi:hypothetical protein [Natronosalvus caseinilyticus]|uniref:hypothetical protein n=1 Tax=Natronosalvus caseinilyticus TaxID=2953747 RepID=UPI0028AD3A16|nr:hypothetical protein [Natronosalvus caseinilyticus]
MDALAGTRALLVVACLLLAGCTGLAGDDSVDREAYGVDEPVQPDESPDVAGLGADNVTNWIALWSGHVGYLEGTSYEATAEVTYVDPNGTVLETRRSKAVVTGTGPERITVERTEHDPETNETATRTIDQWVDDNGAAHRLTEENRTTVNSGPLVSDPATRLLFEPGALFDAVEAVTQTRSDRGMRYVLTGSGNVVPYQDAEFAVLVADDGYIERLVLRGNGTRRGEPVEVTVHVTVDRVGEVIDLERPDWVPANTR